MNEFLEFVLKRLVEHPDDILIRHAEDGSVLYFKITARQSDVGRIIGKSGHTIHALRTLMSAAASRHDHKVMIDVEEAPEMV